MKTSLLMTLILQALLLSACGPDGDAEPVGTAEADLEAACSSMPNLPFCNKDPKPGFAKFAVGSADAVRWSGTALCHQIDFRTGRHGADRLTKAAGEVKSLCKDDEVHFEFVYRKHSKALTADAWTSAFRPLSIKAANRLLDSCTSNSRPNSSIVMNNWWKANNTYAENLMLDYIAPLVFATKLLPFSDDGIKRIGEEAIDGVETVQFRNESATVWMYANINKNRPLRVVNTTRDTDAFFTEWDIPFAADIPEEMRTLDEICETD